MGLNMPAKTVIFTAVKKYDGQESRWISSGEYIQMSGRAGRRGKDDKGLCIMMVDDSLDMDSCRCTLPHIGCSSVVPAVHKPPSSCVSLSSTPGMTFARLA